MQLLHFIVLKILYGAIQDSYSESLLCDGWSFENINFFLYPIHLHTILVFLLQNVSTISVTYSYSGHVLFFCSKLLYSVIVQNPCLGHTSLKKHMLMNFIYVIFKRISDFHAVHIAYMKLNKKLWNDLVCMFLKKKINYAGCLQSAYSLYTFRIESIAHGKPAPVDELQFHGVYNPDLLRKVLLCAIANNGPYKMYFTPVNLLYHLISVVLFLWLKIIIHFGVFCCHKISTCIRIFSRLFAAVCFIILWRLLSEKLPGETKKSWFRELDCTLGKALPIFHQLVDFTLLVPR